MERGAPQGVPPEFSGRVYSMERGPPWGTLREGASRILREGILHSQHSQVTSSGGASRITSTLCILRGFLRGWTNTCRYIHTPQGGYPPWRGVPPPGGGTVTARVKIRLFDCQGWWPWLGWFTWDFWKTFAPHLYICLHIFAYVSYFLGSKIDSF